MLRPMTQPPSQHRQEIVVEGAWSGAVHDPARRFAGTVRRSAHPDVAAGTEAQVAFEHGGGRVPGPSEHGRYVLRVPENGAEVLLTSFTCAEMAASGPHGQDDTVHAQWLAVTAEK